MLIYYPQFIPSESNANLMFDILNQELAWVRRFNTPRDEYYYHALKLPYTYGVGMGKRTYHPQPQHRLIDRINAEINRITGLPLFEICFLNKYNNGLDALGWHADDEPTIDVNRPIAIVTLGQPRVLEWKPQIKGSHAESQLLGNGSLALMPPGMQQTHFHRIKKGTEDMGPRISLTYRGYKAD